MKLLRAFTWYFRFVNRQVDRFNGLFQTPGSFAGQGPLVLFYVFIPAMTGWLTFAMLYRSGLAAMIWEGYVPGFLAIGNETIFSYGATTFAVYATLVSSAYFIFGSLCCIVDAFRPPNYQNKRHLWKDWPDDL